MKPNKTVTISLIALAVAIVAGGAFYLWQKRQNADAAPAAPFAPAPTAALKLPISPAMPYTAPKPAPKPATGKAGASAYPKGTSVNVRTAPSTASKILFEVRKGIKAGVATGETKQMPDGLWHKINTAKGAGWVRSDVVTLSYV